MPDSTLEQLTERYEAERSAKATRYMRASKTSGLVLRARMKRHFPRGRAYGRLLRVCNQWDTTLTDFICMGHRCSPSSCTMEVKRTDEEDITAFVTTKFNGLVHSPEFLREAEGGPTVCIDPSDPPEQIVFSSAKPM